MQVKYDDPELQVPQMQQDIQHSEVNPPSNINDHRLDELKQRAAQYVQMTDDRKYVSFSKRLLIAGLAISFIMCIVCAVLRIKYGTDISDIMTITLASFGMDSTYGGFYFWKEKNANRAKYAQQFVLLFADEYGVDSAIRIAEIVLRD